MKNSLGTGIVCALLVASTPNASAQTTAKPAAPAATHQQTFDTPKEAADALIAASDPFDTEALKRILGPDGEKLVVTKDAVLDKLQGQSFAAKAREKSSVVVDEKNPGHATLFVGELDWPMPIPIVRTGGKWRFDVKAGRKEVLYRRIGRNELDAIDVCRDFVAAQHAYAVEKHDDSRVNQYAQKIISTPGKQDGLAWRVADGTPAGPLGDTIAQAIAEGYTKKSEPLHGYYFKVLKGQGPAAPLGKLDFVVEGAMIGGFALAAAPAEYRVTGVKTFIVSHEGVVYEKDLGPKTLEQLQGDGALQPGQDVEAGRGALRVTPRPHGGGDVPNSQTSMTPSSSGNSSSRPGPCRAVSTAWLASNGSRGSVVPWYV